MTFLVLARLLLLALAGFAVDAANVFLDNPIDSFNCSADQYDSGDSFADTLTALLKELRNASYASYYHSAVADGGGGGEAAHGFMQCRADLAPADCGACVSALLDTYIPQNCEKGKALKMWAWAATCYLQYQNFSIADDDASVDDSPFVYAYNVDNNSSTAFLANRATAIAAVQSAASFSPLRCNWTAVGGDDRVYALAICLAFRSSDHCASCFSNISDKINSTLYRYKGAGIHAGFDCFTRFETYTFTLSNDNSTVQELSPSALPAALSPYPLQAPSPLSNKHAKTMKSIMVIGFATGGIVLFVVLSIMLYYAFMWHNKQRHSSKLIERQIEDSTVYYQNYQDENGTDNRKAYNVQEYSMIELRRATNNFHDENKIGQGGFGTVYKGQLDNGMLVAVKRITPPKQHRTTDFVNELKLISSVQHRNLIKLLGYCVDGSESILIYEFFHKGSLDKYLFDPILAPTLNWRSRWNIIVGIAKGLAYLHEDSVVCIIHRDIKPSNIFLDDDLTAKIADFGIARLLDDDVSHLTTRVAGTYGYIAPEYAVHGLLTKKVDCFCFGVLSLEIVSGRNHVDMELPEGETFLQWVWKLHGELRHTEIVDQRLGGDFSIDEIIRIVHVALLCVQMQPKLRPSMSHVFSLLTTNSNILDIPTTPAFIEITDSSTYEDEKNDLLTSSTITSSIDFPSIQNYSNDTDPISKVEPR